jgi:glycosyltransferase involved in cell wall biosynthesis
MQRRKHTVLLIATPGTPVFQKALQEGIPVEPLKVKQAYTDIMAARRLALILKKSQTRVLIFSMAKDIYVGGWARLFFYPQLQLMYMQQMQLGIAKKGWVQTLLYRQLAAWVAPLHLLAEQVKLKTHMPHQRIHVIPLGIEASNFVEVSQQKTLARQKLQLQFPLSAQSFLIGTIGRLDPAKGQEYLIRAVALLRQRQVEVHALLVGEETRGATQNYPKYLQELAQQLGVESQVHFRPFMEQAEIAFAALDAFVMASKGETYGMVTIEAMAAGLPVIGTNSGGTPELIGNGERGLPVPPEDANAIADALEKLIRDPELRQTIATKGQAFTLTYLSATYQCEQIEALFEEIDETYRGPRIMYLS